MTEEEFQLLVDGFIARHGLSPTTFGLWSLNDSRFVFDLRRGRSCSLATVSKVRRFMTEYERKQEAKRLAMQQAQAGSKRDR
jgi:hypothetical protein